MSTGSTPSIEERLTKVVQIMCTRQKSEGKSWAEIAEYCKAVIPQTKDSLDCEAWVRRQEALEMNNDCHFAPKPVRQLEDESETLNAERTDQANRSLHLLSQGNYLVGVPLLIDVWFLDPDAICVGDEQVVALIQLFRSAANSLPLSMAMEVELLQCMSNMTIKGSSGNTSIMKTASDHLTTALELSCERTDVPRGTLIAMNLNLVNILPQAFSRRQMPREVIKRVVAAASTAIRLMDEAAAEASNGGGPVVVHESLVEALLSRSNARAELGEHGYGMDDLERAYRHADKTIPGTVMILYCSCIQSYKFGMMESSRNFFKKAQKLEAKIFAEKGELVLNPYEQSCKSLAESLMIKMGSHFKGSDGHGVNVKVPGRECAEPSCRKVTSKPKGCSACHGAVYCNRECQVKHWKKHKLSCKAKMAAVKKARENLDID